MLIGPQNSSSVGALGPRLQAVRGRLAAAAAASGRNADRITLIAVSKGHPGAAVRAAWRLGVRDFGESYLQEALPKLADLADLGAVWHFIGRIQGNKTRPIAEHFAWAHGVDRLRIAERLSAQRPADALPLNVCIQVNIAGSAVKAGVAAHAVAPLARAIAPLPRLRLRGLMCILPDAAGPAAQQQHFAAMHRLLQELNADGAALDTLSMGMSGDFGAAIAAGATAVRIGTAIFGAR